MVAPKQVVVLTTGVGEGEVNFDNMQVRTDSNESSSDGNIAFQLFEGEEMDAKMANFIGIHMLNDLVQTEEDLQEQPVDDLSGASSDMPPDGQYCCPQTGAHFHYKDFIKRLKKLQKRRAIIDKAIEEEDRSRRPMHTTYQTQQPVYAGSKQHHTDGDERIQQEQPKDLLVNQRSQI